MLQLPSRASGLCHMSAEARCAAALCVNDSERFARPVFGFPHPATRSYEVDKG